VSGRASSPGRRNAARPARGRTLGAEGDSGSDDTQQARRAARHSALLRLARRDQSASELRRALELKGHSADAIEHTLARLAQERLLDDQAFAERFARRALGRGLGSRRIAAALGTRGVARELVRAGVERARSDTPEELVVDRLAQRYWQCHARIEPERRLRRLWAYLLRRGFAAALVSARLRALAPELDQAVDSLSAESN
jgi:regulatory protein